MNHTPDPMDKAPGPATDSPAAEGPKLADPRRHSRRTLLVLVSVIVAVGGIVALMADSSGVEFYKHVDEIKGKEASLSGKRLQLHGFVVPGTLLKRFDRDHQKLEYRFQVENCGAVVDAHFAGVVPDTFKEGAEVVLKGKLGGERFESDEIMAKCPSKYAQGGEAQSQMVTRCARDKKAN